MLWAFLEGPRLSVANGRTSRFQNRPRLVVEWTPPPSGSPRTRAPSSGGTGAGSTTPDTARPRPSTLGPRRRTAHTSPRPGAAGPCGRS